MKIGIPKEIKAQERRVAATPFGVAEMVARGFEVAVECGAGVGIGATDGDYEKAGARVVSRTEAWDSNMVLKVKEPLMEEWEFLRKDLTLFAYLHLAAAPELARKLMESKCRAIAFETIMVDGKLPLLAPMSRIAGKLSVQFGARGLESTVGGKGLLLSGDQESGIMPAKTLVIGAGNVGRKAAEVAFGMGSDVTIMDVSGKALEYAGETFAFSASFPDALGLEKMSASSLKKFISSADLVIGAALVVGDSAPRMLTKDVLRLMPKGGVVVDVSIDQGGCVEGIAATSHAAPFSVVDGLVMCAVPNFPGAVPRTSSYALERATLPWTVDIASGHVASDVSGGVNVIGGRIVHPAVAKALGF